MTEQDLDNLHFRYGQVLQHLSATNSRLADNTVATNASTQAVWAVEAKMAGLSQCVTDLSRRVDGVEEWQRAKSDEVTATGRHDITELRRQLKEREAARTLKRSKLVAWAAGIAGTVVAAGILGWAGAVFSGCM